ncbi:MAG: FtsX-like permease family protein, partial [Pirellulaceae bacterium]
RVNGDLVLINAVRYTLPANERFDRRRIEQARGVAGVAAAYPLYMETVAGLLRQRTERAYPIRVIAVRAEDPVLSATPLRMSHPELLRPGTALADRASRSQYGIPAAADRLVDYTAELSGQRIQLVGSFRLGVDFATEGNLLMSAENFANYFPWRAGGRDPLSIVDLGVIQLTPGADVATVQQAVRAALPNDVVVLTRAQFIEREMDFWRTNAPVGYIFLVGVYVGFIVGVVICYQILYSDIAGHMREFATLKAMGYSNWYFLALVLQQAALLSVMGFVPGSIVSWFCYGALSQFTGLTMQLTWQLALTVLAVTLGMCGVSGLLALRKLLTMDPADLF